MSLPTIRNSNLRRALLSVCGLSPVAKEDPLPAPEAERGPEWARGMLRRLGFVQVDAVSAVERAQEHILFSRNPRYRQEDMRRLLEDDRLAFENWTHDAAILPIESYPYWKHYVERQRRYEVHPGYRRYFELATAEQIAHARERVAADGPLRPRDIVSDKVDIDHDYFARPSAAKVALEYLWRTGTLAIARREAREKVYDLAERVIPAKWYKPRVSKADYRDWACRESLLRLGVAAPAQIAHCYDAVSTDEAAAWCKRRLGKEVVEVRVEQADGRLGTACFAHEAFLEVVRDPPAPPRRLRLLNPFDPLIHDRRRTQRIFGFDYTIEIWVPAAKRKYGYYVLPILEGDRFTGRVDCKVDRKQARLNVLGLWWEPGVRPKKSRVPQLERELQRLAKFCGAESVRFARKAAAALA